MNRPILIHGGLLIAALITAYFVWTREPTGTEDEISIVSLRGALDRAIYTSDDRTVTVTRKKDDKGSYNWLKVVTMEAPPPVPRLRPRPVPKTPEPPAPAPTAPAPKAQGAPRPQATPTPRPAPKVVPPPDHRPMPRVVNKPIPKVVNKPIPRVVNKPIPRVVNKPNPKANKPGVKDPKAGPRVKINPQAAPDPALGPKAAPQPNPAPQMARPAPKITTAAKAQPKKERKVKEFLGNKAAEVLMEGLASLSAIRSLGKLDTSKLKAFGLHEAKKTLTLVSGSTPRVFVIGDNTFGNQDTYLLSKDDGRVYVIRPRLLQDFLYADSRLMERELLDFRITEVDRVVVSDGQQKRALLQKNPSEPANAYWVDEAAPEQRKDFYRNWFDKLNRLRAVEYVPTRNKIEGLTPVFEHAYFRDGKPKGQLKVFKKVTLIPGVTGAAPGGGGDYYIESSHNRTQVKISKHLGDELARDLKNLFKE